MIFKRASAKLRAQDWTAISIELAIVVVGVFIGMWVANWNQARVERANTIRLLNQFKPELTYQFDEYHRLKTYMETTGEYGEVALKGWRNDPSITDKQFVIAAYQASQVTGSAINTQTWAGIFGSNQVQNITDPNLRSALIRVLSIDSSLTDYRQIQDAYRENVRRVIPDDVQGRIRGQCGDRIQRDVFGVYLLPAHCDVDLTSEQVRTAAAALRAHPSLVGDLNWHRALVATMMANWLLQVRAMQRLSAAIDHQS